MYVDLIPANVLNLFIVLALVNSLCGVCGRFCTEMPRFTVLTGTACSFRLKAGDNPVWSKSFGVSFPVTFAPLMSLCYILVIPRIFQTFSLFSLL